MVEYVVAVGDGILAALRDRPVTMERWPGGYRPEVKLTHPDRLARRRVLPEAGAQPGMPDWVETVTITFPSGRTADEVCATELATIVWMANLGTLRYHPWPVKRADTEKVDQLRIDLDPQPGTDFADAVRAAHELRAVLADAGLVGLSEDQRRARGARVRADRADVRLHRGPARGDRDRPRAGPPDARPGHHQLVEGGAGRADLRRLQPDGRDRTIASAYSIRPTPTAVVSAPLTWDELPRRRARGLHRQLHAGPVRRGGRRLGAVLRRAGPRTRRRLEWYARDERDLGTVIRGRRDALPAGLPEDARRAVRGSSRAGRRALGRTGQPDH